MSKQYTFADKKHNRQLQRARHHVSKRAVVKAALQIGHPRLPSLEIQGEERESS